MSDEKMNNDSAVENTTNIIPRGEVNILVTDEDKTGEDLLAMSNFFNGYEEVTFDVIDSAFLLLSEYSDKKSYTTHFIIRIFLEIIEFTAFVFKKDADNNIFDNCCLV